MPVVGLLDPSAVVFAYVARAAPTIPGFIPANPSAGVFVSKLTVDKGRKKRETNILKHA